jgi:hypothetical protein
MEESEEFRECQRNEKRGLSVFLDFSTQAVLVVYR